MLICNFIHVWLKNKALERSSKIFNKLGDASKDELKNLGKAVVGVVANVLEVSVVGSGEDNTVCSSAVFNFTF